MSVEKRILEGAHGTYRLGELHERTESCIVYRVYPARRNFWERRRSALAARQIPTIFENPHERREALASFGLDAERYLDLVHPHLARFVDWSADHTYFFTIFELVPGLSLSQLLERYYEPVDEELVVYLAAQGASALRYLHGRGLTFGDLTPGSVVIRREGYACLTDLGLTRRVLRRASGEPAYGLAGYAAPEAWSPGATPTPVSDVYAFGAVLWQIVTLQDPRTRPVPLPGPRSVHPRVSLWMDAFVQKCTRAAPSERFPDMDAVLAELVVRDPGLARFARPPGSGSLLDRLLRRGG